MGTIASQITSLTIVYWTVIQAQIKENIKAPRHWPLCGEFTGTGEFPAQRASNAENVSIWWCHHVERPWCSCDIIVKYQLYGTSITCIIPQLSILLRKLTQAKITLKFSCGLIHLPVQYDHHQMTFSNAFSWMKSFVFSFKFHWSLFPRVLLTICQHWFR